MENHCLAIIALFGLIWGTVIFALEGDADAGRNKIESCIACHGEDGNSSESLWPKIAGQHPGYVLEQMLEFKKGDDGKRPNPAMYGLLQELSTQDLADLAAYYATQKTTIGKTQKNYYELGKQIYRGGIKEKGIPACSGCHGPSGQGNSAANFPKLSGQNAEYTIGELKNYREDERLTGPIMSDIAKKMTDQEIEAIAHYVMGLH